MSQATVDLCNEREWNPDLKSVEKLTDGPVGVGTRYRAEWGSGGLNTVECTRWDRPGFWEHVADSKNLQFGFQGRVTPTAAGSRLVIRMELRPRGLARLAMPILRRVFQRGEVRNLAAIKRTLEARTG
ncbi:MAG TPA: SRPBCC family protein [Candidatus Limnocylindrales bacterium]